LELVVDEAAEAEDLAELASRPEHELDLANVQAQRLRETGGRGGGRKPDRAAALVDRARRRRSRLAEQRGLGLGRGAGVSCNGRGHARASVDRLVNMYACTAPPRVPRARGRDGTAKSGRGSRLVAPRATAPRAPIRVPRAAARRAPGRAA